jgi:PAS domain S-box-containing protein
MRRLLGNKFALAISIGVIVLSLVLEFLSPAGLYFSCGYVIAVMVTLPTSSKFETIIVTTIGVFAIICSVFFIHPPDQMHLTTINHAISLFVLFFVMFFILWVKDFMQHADADNKQVNTLFNHATEGIILADSKGEIVLANPFAEHLFGYEKDELVGKSVDDLVPSRIKETHHHHRDSFIKKPENRPMGVGRDLYAKRKDGREFPVEISLSHYQMNGQKYVIAFIIDISIRKKNEEILSNQTHELERITKEIKLLNISLEKKVEERTMMLRETLNQLEQSKSDLSISLEKEKELGELKSRFVSIASHEFRTPLSAILSSVSLIDRYKNPEDEQKRIKHIERIKENVSHLNEMLKDLLSLGKLEEGMIKAAPELFDANEQIKELCIEMQEIAKQGQTIEYNFTGNTVGFSDKKLLRNVLVNLISNAIKFSLENEVIAVSAQQDQDNLIISIADRGIGISKEDQEKLFERFFRAKNAVNIQGTGLGLHIVKKYVDLLQGNIQIKSELEKGTTFTLIIPMKNTECI